MIFLQMILIELIHGQNMLLFIYQVNIYGMVIVIIVMHIKQVLLKILQYEILGEQHYKLNLYIQNVMKLEEE
jgi:hypothetical protein